MTYIYEDKDISCEAHRLTSAGNGGGEWTLVLCPVVQCDPVREEQPEDFTKYSLLQPVPVATWSKA